jgi:cobalamin biosynthesis Mg chelatase CobN
MNMDALYGSAVASSAPRTGAQALTAASLEALPASVSPYDTAAALGAAKAATTQSLPNGLIFALLLTALVIWIWWGRRGR